MQSQISPQTRLLKANDLRGLGSKVAFNFEDLAKRGEAYVDSVRTQAQEMLTAAESEVEAIRERARDQGYEQGRHEGLRQAAEMIEQQARALADKAVRENLATTLPAMRSAAEALVIERDRWLAEWETTAVKVAAAIAERLIKRRIEVDPQIVREMIRSALQLAVGTPQIRLRLHDGDADLLGEHGPEVVRALASCGRAEIIRDSSLRRGSCLVETQHGTIDARLETLLERIASELLDCES